MRKISLLLVITLILGCVVDPRFVQAAEPIPISASQENIIVSRADVFCVYIQELYDLFAYSDSDAYGDGSNYRLTSTGTDSGFWVNNVKTSDSMVLYFEEYGLYMEAIKFKDGAAWTTGDYVQMKGTFTQPISSTVFEVDLLFHCTYAEGADAYSTATWELIPQSEYPSFVSITGLSDSGSNGTGAYATLTTSDQIVGSSTGSTTEQSVTVLRDGVETTITVQRSGDNTLFVQTSDDVETLTSTVTYVIPAKTEIKFDNLTCYITEDFTFYATKDGLLGCLPLELAYRDCENQETNSRWKLMANVTPEVSGYGTLGSASAILQSPNGEETTVTIQKVCTGDISSEVVFYLDYETIGKPSDLEEGTKLAIQKGELNESLLIQNDMSLTWNGTTWTDLVNVDDIVGDANGDNKLDVKDLVRYLNTLGNKATFADDYVSDLNKDAETNAFDVRLEREMLLDKALDTISFNCAMDVTEPTTEEIVYPYVDSVYDFLTTEDADINDYKTAGTYQEGDGSLKDIAITWNGITSEEAQYVDKYVVEYATKEDFSDALTVATDETLNDTGINNLYKASDYYVRVTAYAGNIVLGQTKAVQFKTTDIGPRLMTVDGIYNVRDLGGYVTEGGKRTLQGLVYRGGEMDGIHNINLTEAGDDIMSNLMGIKLDMDFRSLSECNYATESPISSATKIHYTIQGYTDIFTDTSNQEKIRQIFSAFANESNYPIYFHCWGGADRTGTIAFLLNGLCGVSEMELVQDYEMTSYSIFGVRADDSTEYNFAPFLTQLKTYDGDTLSAKIENYLLSIGVTPTEIYNIKAIMFGEETIEVTSDYVNLTDYWATETGKVTLDSSTKQASSDTAVGYGNKVRIDVTTDTADTGDTYFFIGSYGVQLRSNTFRVFTLTNSGTYAEVARPSLDCSTDAFETEGAYLILGTEVVSDTEIKLTYEVVNAQGVSTYSGSYTFTRISDEIASANAKVTIAMNITKSGAMNSVTVKTGIKEAEEETDILNLADYWKTETGYFTLDSNTPKASSDTAIGYGNKLQIDFTTIPADSSGSAYFFVGSYGVRLRGDSLRMSTLTSAGTYGELSTRVEVTTCANSEFETEGAYLILETQVISETQIMLTVTAVRANGEEICKGSHTFTRISDEIDSENAKATIIIDSGNTASVTVKTGVKTSGETENKYLADIEGTDYEFFIEPLSDDNSVKWDETTSSFHLTNLVSAADDTRGFIFNKEYLQAIIANTEAVSISFEYKTDGIASGIEDTTSDPGIYQAFWPNWWDAEGNRTRVDLTEQWTSVEIFFDNIPLDTDGSIKTIFLLNTVQGMYVRNIKVNVAKVVETSETCDFFVDVASGRDPVVLQLTDTQIIDPDQDRRETPLTTMEKEYWAKTKIKERLYNDITETINATKPDLILLTGDLVYGEFDDAGTALTGLIEFMDSFEIPWAPVFGNHENESAKGVDWQSEQLENAKYCLFKQRDLEGNGNYTVGIRQDGELKRVFFMLDSNGCSAASAESLANGHTERAVGFGTDQIKWYTETAEKIKAASPQVKLSFAFHIQLAAFENAYIQYGFDSSSLADGSSSALANPINIDKQNNKVDGDFGYLGRVLKSAWDSDATVYNGLKNLGVDSIFVGHEHCNSASVVYDGIRFQYGQKTGTYDRANYVTNDGTVYGTYCGTDTPLSGGTVVTLSEADGSITNAYIYLCGDAEAKLNGTYEEPSTEVSGLQYGTDLTNTSVVSVEAATISGENAWKCTANSQGSVSVKTDLLAGKTTFTFSVYVPSGSNKLEGLGEFAIRVKISDTSYPTVGLCKNGYINYNNSATDSRLKLEYDQWQTFTIDLSDFSTSFVEWRFDIAAGNTIYLKDIEVK